MSVDPDLLENFLDQERTSYQQIVTKEQKQVIQELIQNSDEGVPPKNGVEIIKRALMSIPVVEKVLTSDWIGLQMDNAVIRKQLELLQTLLNYSTYNPAILAGALITASSKGYTDYVKLLLDHNGSPTLSKKGIYSHYCPIEAAAHGNGKNCIQLLLSATENYKVYESCEQSLAEYAQNCSNLSLFTLSLKLMSLELKGKLIGSPWMAQLLCKAASNNQQNFINRLLSQNCSIDLVEKPGESPTALHIACYHGYDKLTQRLLALNANPDLIQEHQQNALHIACKQNRLECVKILLKGYRGDKLKFIVTPDGSGLKPSEIAAEFPEIVEFLKNTESELIVGEGMLLK